MTHLSGEVVLRRPEPRDIEALYQMKNDKEIASLLGGFSSGFCHADLEEWVEFHRKQRDEVIWVIADTEDDRCLGHAGFYKVDHRIGSAEFAILIGDKRLWGKGIGRSISAQVLAYGFTMLNLNRIELRFLATNDRARSLYRRLGFHEEGVLREAQFKEGAYVDIVVMALLRREFNAP